MCHCTQLLVCYSSATVVCRGRRLLYRHRTLIMVSSHDAPAAMAATVAWRWIWTWKTTRNSPTNAFPATSTVAAAGVNGKSLHLTASKRKAQLYRPNVGDTEEMAKLRKMWHGRDNKHWHGLFCLYGDKTKRPLKVGIAEYRSPGAEIRIEITEVD